MRVGRKPFRVGHLLVLLAATSAWTTPARADEDAVLRPGLGREIRDALADPALANDLPDGARLGSIQVETRRVVLRIDGPDGRSGRLVLSARPRGSGTAGGWFAVQIDSGGGETLDANGLARFGERLAARLDADPWTAPQPTFRRSGSDFNFPRGFVIAKGAVHLLLVLGMFGWSLVLLLGGPRPPDEAPPRAD